MDATHEWLVHPILVTEVRHLIACWSVDVTTKLLLFGFLGLLSSLDPGLVLRELSMALLCLLLELLTPRALFHVVLAVHDIGEHMGHIILAVDHIWITILGHLDICIIINCFLSGFELTPKKV